MAVDDVLSLKFFFCPTWRHYVIISSMNALFGFAAPAAISNLKNVLKSVASGQPLAALWLPALACQQKVTVQYLSHFLRTVPVCPYS
jgi:hypothetical protein